MATSIITASYDKQIRFWDPNSGRTIRTFVFQDSQVNALAMSPDRCRLAVAGYGVIRYYDVASSSQCPPVVASFECSTAGNFTAIGHIPLSNTSGALLFACSEDGVLRLLDPRSTASIRVLREISTGVAITCAALSKDNVLLFTGSQIGKVSMWHCVSLVGEASSSHHSPAASKPLQEVSFSADHSAIRSIAVSPLVRWIAVATNVGKVHCLQLGNAKSSDSLVTPSRPSAFLSVHPHQRSLSDTTAMATASDNASVVSGQAPSTPTVEPSSAPNALIEPANTAQSSELASPTQPTSSSTPSAPRVTVQLSPLQQQYHLDLVHSMSCHHKYILRCAISPNGKILATCCADYSVGLWQVPSILEQPTETPASAVSSPQMMPDSATVSNTASPTTQNPSTEPGSPIPLATTAQTSSSKNLTVLQTPEKRMPSVGAAQTLTFQPLKPLQGHTRWVWDCAFSPCSTALVTVSSDNHVRLWSSITDKPKSDVLVGHTKPVVCVLLDVDRRRLDESKVST